MNYTEGINNKFYIFHRGSFYMEDNNTHTTKTTRDIKEAEYWESIEHVLETSNIMKDWWWDYSLYQLQNNKLIEISEDVWMKVFREMKTSNY